MARPMPLLPPVISAVLPESQLQCHDVISCGPIYFDLYCVPQKGTDHEVRVRHPAGARDSERFRGKKDSN